MIRGFLPDEPSRQADKQFIFDLVNTIDPDFFSAALRELEEYRFRKLQLCEKKDEVIEMDTEMYELFGQMQSVTITTGKSSNSQGKRVLKTESRKRKRPVEHAPYMINAQVVAKPDFMSRVHEPFVLISDKKFH